MNRPVSNPDWRVVFSARWFLVTAAMLPTVFIAWVSFLAYRNAPFWDEFGTTLGFLTRLQDSSSWRETLGLFLAADQHHCMVTSRLIFAGSYLLTGQINFIALATIGNLAILGAILVLAAQPRDWNLRLVYAALLCLLIFQLQHFEN
jgi:nicotinamide riboside transporter PnuC